MSIQPTAEDQLGLVGRLGQGLGVASGGGQVGVGDSVLVIGAGGLGKNVLEALQYAAKGQGMLAGLAILFCAMVIDRIVQGAFRREDHK